MNKQQRVYTIKKNRRPIDVLPSCPTATESIDFSMATAVAQCYILYTQDPT